MPDPTQNPVDYYALADQARQAPAAPSVDYNALADQARAGSSTPQPILGGKAWDSNETKSAPPQSFIDRLGGWRGLAATGVRAGAGILGAEGMVPGAAINAAGETLAEGVEGSDISPTRIATEGAIGAVPFGEILKAGKIGTSMLRSGLYGAVGTGARELASGQSLDPTAIATNAGIGAATGGLLSKFFGHAKAPTEAGAVKAPEYVYEPTSRTGPGTGGLAPGVKGGKPRYTPTEVQRSNVVPVNPDVVANITPTSPANFDEPGYGASPGSVAYPEQQTYAPDVAPSASFLKAEAAAAKQAAIDAKNAAAATEIQNARAEGAVRTPSTPTESYSAPIEGGKESVTYGWKKPKPVKEAASSTSPLAKVLTPRPTTPPDFVPPGLGPKVPSKPTAMSIGGEPLDPERVKQLQKTYPDLMKTLGGTATPEVTSITPDPFPDNPILSRPARAARTARIQANLSGITDSADKFKQQATQIQNELETAGQPLTDLANQVEQPAIVPQSPLAKFFKSPVDAVGEAYRNVKGETGINPLAKQQLGVALQTEAAKAGLPTRGTPNLAKFLSEKVSPDIAAQQGAVAPVAAAAEATPTATFRHFQEDGLGGHFAQYDVQGGKYNKSTVGADRLASEGIPIPETPAPPSAGESPVAGAPDVSGDIYSKPIDERINKLEELQKALGMQDKGPGLPPKSVGAAAANDPTVFETSGGRTAAANLVSKLPASVQEHLGPGLGSRLAYAAVGAPIGATLGSTMEPDDPTYGALKGAVGGAIAGYAGRSGFQQALEKGNPGSFGALKELINWRNSGLLSGLAQIKKPLSDIGAYIGLMGEKGMSGDSATMIRMGKEVLNVHALAKDYIEGWKNPEIARQVLGETNLAREETPTGALGWVTKPFAAAQNLTSKAMQRAGVPAEEATKSMMLGDPTTALGRWWLSAQNLPGAGGQIVRAIRPFARIGTNIAERGLERTPGIGMFMGDPSTRLARQGMGTLATGLGIATGGIDSANAEAGDPTSGGIKGLRRAGMASYGLPFALGEAIGGQDAREIYDLIPGLRANMEPPPPNSSVFEWVRQLAANGLDQFIPAVIDQAQQKSGAAR